MIDETEISRIKTMMAKHSQPTEVIALIIKRYRGKGMDSMRNAGYGGTAKL